MLMIPTARLCLALLPSSVTARSIRYVLCPLPLIITVGSSHTRPWMGDGWGSGLDKPPDAGSKPRAPAPSLYLSLRVLYMILILGEG